MALGASPLGTLPLGSLVAYPVAAEPVDGVTAIVTIPLALSVAAEGSIPEVFSATVSAQVCISAAALGVVGVAGGASAALGLSIAATGGLGKYATISFPLGVLASVIGAVGNAAEIAAEIWLDVGASGSTIKPCTATVSIELPIMCACFGSTPADPLPNTITVIRRLNSMTVYGL